MPPINTNRQDAMRLIGTQQANSNSHYDKSHHLQDLLTTEALLWGFTFFFLLLGLTS